MTIILGCGKEEIANSSIGDDEVIGFAKIDIATGEEYFDLGYLLCIAFVDIRNGNIAGWESDNFDDSDEYKNNPSSYERVWIIQEG